MKIPNLPAAFYLLRNSVRISGLIETASFPVILNGYIPTLGGKGGFGSQLKSQGNRMSSIKSTNFDASRDLSGRRLRVVQEATRLADFIQAAPERKKKEVKRNFTYIGGARD